MTLKNLIAITLLLFAVAFLFDQTATARGSPNLQTTVTTLAIVNCDTFAVDAPSRPVQLEDTLAITSNPANPMAGDKRPTWLSIRFVRRE